MEVGIGFPPGRDQRLDFITAYEEHVWDVYGFLAYRLESRSDAEDLTQATFERAFKAWDRFDETKASVRTWLLVIARNGLIDQARKRGGYRAVAEPLQHELPSSPGPEETSLGLSPELEAALGRLSQREREVLSLRFGGDLRGPEIAEMLNLSLANVQQILSRGLRKLRDELSSASGESAEEKN